MQRKIIISDNWSSIDHKETSPSRVKRDIEDFKNISDWFQSHNPITAPTDLICFDSGIVEEKHAIMLNILELPSIKN